MFRNTRGFTYSPGGFSSEDFPRRRAAQYDEPMPPPLQRNGMFRPNARAIYNQRKEYSETLSRPADRFHVRVEHLFTGELDGRDLRTLEDCLSRLKLLDAKGRLWPQDMTMDVQGGYLVLSDIETKDELEALPSRSIVQTKAVLDSCAYNSLLIISVQQRNTKQVFMFQCDEIGADVLKSDLDKLLNIRGDQQDFRREPTDFTYGDRRRNMENDIHQQSFRASPVQPEKIQTPVYQERIQTPVYQERIQTPVYQERIQTPVYQERIQTPVYQERMQTPVYQERILIPVQPERIQTPVYQERILIPVQPERVQIPVQPERVQIPVQPERVQTPVQPERVQIPVQPERVQTPVYQERIQTPVQPERIQTPEEPERIQIPVQPERVQIPVQPERVQTPVQPERIQTPEEPQLTRQYSSREPDYASLPQTYSPPKDPVIPPEPRSSAQTSTASPEVERDTHILNHVIDDMEIFCDKVTAAAATQQGKKKKLVKKPKKPTMPFWEEYISFLQKVKYGFNLLGELDGSLSNPTASDFVHIFFSTLEQVIVHYPPHLPPSVVSPLLTDAAVELLEQVATAEENQLWRSLGDCWNIPRSRWPNSNVEPYVPQFYSGWQPPAPVFVPPSQSDGTSGWRNTSQRDAPSKGYMREPMQRQADEPDRNSSWNLPPAEPTLTMRAMYDFVARNSHELSILTGEEVKVVQKSGGWWLVRNSHGQEGNVPQNVLEPIRNDSPPDNLLRDSRGDVTLDMNSSPADVKAWLRHKGFSNTTLSGLGVLTGKDLLGMSRNDMKNICPEEGGKVFFQLQAVKSAIALSSEQSGMYNNPY